MQRSWGWTVWLTGLPASGKTTVAYALQNMLQQQHGINAIMLDSDELRPILTPNADYSQQERDAFYMGLTALTELLTHQQVNVIIAATANLRRYRQEARLRLHRFYEIWVQCPLEVCRQRDPKGLYAQADQQQINTLPGAGALYEPPLDPTLILNSATQSPETLAEQIIARCALAN